jgi:PKD repeat protein
MKKWMTLIAIALILFLISAGCSSKVSESRGYPVTATMTATQATAVPPMVAPAPMPVFNSGSGGAYKAPVPEITVTVPPVQGNDASGTGDTGTIDRMVIRTGNLHLVVKDITTSLDKIIKIAADNGGYVVNSQQWKENERNFGSISIRVVAENYDKTIAALRSLAVSVTSESTSSQDVTQEYTDLSSRLRNLQATEAQLLKIMENATKTEDVLAVQRELTTVRGDIEQTKGRMLYLERTSSTSLINISLNEAIFGLKFSADKARVNTNETVTFTPEITGGFEPFNYQWDFGDGDQSTETSPHHAYKKGGEYTVVLTVTDDKGYSNQVVRDRYINVLSNWNAGSVAAAAWNALKVFAKGVANALIWIVTFAPVWIIIGAIVWFALYMRKRSARKAAEKKSPPQDKL